MCISGFIKIKNSDFDLFMVTNRNKKLFKSFYSK